MSFLSEAWRKFWPEDLVFLTVVNGVAAMINSFRSITLQSTNTAATSVGQPEQANRRLT